MAHHLYFSYDVEGSVEPEVRYIITGAMYGIAASSRIKLPNIDIEEDQTEHIVFESRYEDKLVEVKGAIEKVLRYLKKEYNFKLHEVEKLNMNPPENTIEYTLEIKILKI